MSYDAQTEALAERLRIKSLFTKLKLISNDINDFINVHEKYGYGVSFDDEQKKVARDLIDLCKYIEEN